MRDENEFNPTTKPRKKTKKVRAFIPEIETRIRPVVAEPSTLDDFFEMPPPANEPLSEPEKEESYLALIGRICEENHLPFISGWRYFAIGNIQPDFVCTDRMVVLEVYDSHRTPREITARVKALHHHGFKVQLITADDLMRKDAQERCVRIIRSLLK